MAIDPVNVVILRGRLSRPPEQRVLPSGDLLAIFEVTVPASGEQRTETAPVVWPGAPASALELAEDDEVVVAGRIRRRFFRAAGSVQSRTEVVAHAVVPARRRARAASVVQAAVERAGAHAPVRAATTPGRRSRLVR
jgi:single-strand DNA-binding protein